MSLIDEIDIFISQTKEVREIQRALAAKMAIEGHAYSEIQELLKVSHGFVSKWKNQAIFQGIESFRLQYKGTIGYLKPQERQQVVKWLRKQDYLRLSDLKRYLEKRYKIIYESEQSYYKLLKEARA